jgi:replicative DNA helicase
VEVERGDLVLVGARPGQGKTAWAVEMLVLALREGRRGWFFSLLNDPPCLNAIFAARGEQISAYAGSFLFDDSDDICARYVIDQVRRFATEGAVVVIDHLQLLDQRRRFPELQQQVGELRTFAKTSGCIVIFISQIDSSFDDVGELVPRIQDVRLPNALDLDAFDRLLFLHDGRRRLHVRPDPALAR